jgi:hypothetical protein
MTSCSDDKVIYYEYKGLVVTRVNNYPRDRFFYGKYDITKDRLPSTYIESQFSGFNSGMGGYLIFNKNNTIDVMGMYASFKKVGNSKLINLAEKMDNVSFIHWKDSATMEPNIFYISDAIELETGKYRLDNSRVRTVRK